ENVVMDARVRPDLGERAALRRIGGDVVEMLERRWIFEVAEGRDAMPLGTFVRQRRARDRRSERPGPEGEGVASRQLADVGHGRVPVLEAFSASHHHTVGNAEAPYFGSGSCRLKRSQRAVRLLSKVNCGTTWWFQSSTRSRALVAATSSARSLAKITRSISASTAGFLMPT